MNSPGKLLAFVGPTGNSGPILDFTQAFDDTLMAGSMDVCEYGLPAAKLYQYAGGPGGLLVFEGWIEVGSEPDPDVSFVGRWRRLTHWEVCQLRFGRSIFDDLGRVK